MATQASDAPAPDAAADAPSPSSKSPVQEQRIGEEKSAGVADCPLAQTEPQILPGVAQCAVALPTEIQETNGIVDTGPCMSLENGQGSMDPQLWGELKTLARRMLDSLGHDDHRTMKDMLQALLQCSSDEVRPCSVCAER
jgi:hypothetical protein